tara:strand:+ start:20346 stop:20987 length:642 start_codon:yes stop_codon:yes gene_type:complete
MPKIKLAPSILSADENNINKEIEQVAHYAKLIHVDIMDGIFVPQTTWTSDFVKTIKTKIPLDVHLMVQDPSDEYLKGFIDANAYSITVHQEACSDLQHTLEFIKKNNTKTCIALKPNTPLKKISEFIDQIDMVLIMTVEPGKAGQAFIPGPLKKAEELRKLKPNLDIEVDGGINKATINSCYKSGANVFVAGSAIFKQLDRIKAIKELLNNLK